MTLLVMINQGVNLREIKIDKKSQLDYTLNRN